MTDRPAVIQAQLVDVRNVAAHKCIRLELHVPAEQAGLVLAAFGWPTAVDPVPVALARLASDAVQGGLTTMARERAERRMEPLEPPERRRFSDMAYSQQAYLRCTKPEFWKFLAVKVGSGCNDAERAAHIVRAVCKVESRRELDSDAEAGAAWTRLEADYYGWQRGAR